jgi:hypothetical protein
MENNLESYLFDNKSSKNLITATFNNPAPDQIKIQENLNIKSFTDNNTKELRTQIYLQQNLFDMDKYINPENNLHQVDVSIISSPKKIIENPSNNIQQQISRNISPLKNNHQVSYQERITELSLKNKLLKINSSMKAFNILLKPNSNLTKFDYQQIPPSLAENYHTLEGKNYFINFLMEFIIDLIWKVKEENLQKDQLLEKINEMNNHTSELNRKIKKLQNELEDSKRENKMIFNKIENEKEKNFKDQKFHSSEFNEIKNENKKLHNMTNLYKTEIKKKEAEYLKLQEKYKKILNITHEKLVYNKNQKFQLDYALPLNTINANHTIQESNEKLNLFNKTILESTQRKLNLVSNQNSCLFHVMKNLKNYIENFTQIIHKKLSKLNNKMQSSFPPENEGINSNFGYENSEYFYDLINIKENMFSVHLLEKNMLDDFYNNYLTYLKKFDEILNVIVDSNQIVAKDEILNIIKKESIKENEHNKSDINKRNTTSNISQHPRLSQSIQVNPSQSIKNLFKPQNNQEVYRKESLIRKSFLKNKNQSLSQIEFPMNIENPINENKEIIKNFRKWSISKNSNDFVKNNEDKNIGESSRGSLLSNKWFDNIENPKEVQYTFDENLVIK